jgi:DNA-binding MarR family transcriptional regulator
MYRDEDDLNLLAELAGVLDDRVARSGLSSGSYLILRDLVRNPGPHGVVAIAGRLNATPDEVAPLCSRLIDLRMAQMRPAGIELTERGIEQAAAIEADANVAMRDHVLERPHTATVYGLVASMQAGRFTVEDLLEMLAQGPSTGEDEDPE